jgi:hypothetical protein
MHPFGDRDHGTAIPADVRKELDTRFRARGTSLATVELTELRIALVNLSKRPEIDPARIATIGLSYAAAVDPRVAVPQARAISDAHANLMGKWLTLSLNPASAPRIRLV